MLKEWSSRDPFVAFKQRRAKISKFLIGSLNSNVIPSMSRLIQLHILDNPDDYLKRFTGTQYHSDWLRKLEQVELNTVDGTFGSANTVRRGRSPKLRSPKLHLKFRIEIARQTMLSTKRNENPFLNIRISRRHLFCSICCQKEIDTVNETMSIR